MCIASVYTTVVIVRGSLFLSILLFLRPIILRRLCLYLIGAQSELVTGSECEGERGDDQSGTNSGVRRVALQCLSHLTHVQGQLTTFLVQKDSPCVLSFGAHETSSNLLLTVEKKTLILTTVHHYNMAESYK